MLKLTWRNLLARKLRLALSATAIVLGVAFVAGSFIFTSAMGDTFDSIIEGSTSDVEIAYRGANDFDSQSDVRVMPVAVVRRLEGLREVESVHPTVQLESVYLIGRDGKVVGANGPPGLAVNDTGARSVRGNPVLVVTQGSMPTRPGQVALDVSTAERAGYGVGDRVRFVTPGDPPTLSATVSGLVTSGSGGFAGASLSVFDRGELQQAFFGGRDVYTSISLTAADGVSQVQLRDAAQRLLPDGVVARAGDALVESNKKQLDTVLGFLNTFLLVFAAVSLVVGTFLIINTFSILVAQRSRELALLRALGASRRQVNVSVLLEAAVVGFVGSTLGVGAGYLLARALQGLFALFGLDLSGASFSVGPRAVLASYTVGLLVTLIAAYLPARRAGSVPPVAALRDDVALPESSLRRRVLIGFGLIVLGIASMVVGFAVDGDLGLTLIGLGMLAVLVGVSLLSPWLGRPLTRGFEVAYRRLFGTVGTLAAQNSLRNPRRTAATASALMIGLTLVTLISILGRSASASTDAAVERALTSQLVVSNVVNTPFSPSIADRIREVDGVRSVAALRTASAQDRDRRAFVAAVSPRDLGLALAIPMRSGSLLGLGPGTLAVSSRTAASRGYQVGDTIPLTFQGGTVPLRLVAVFDRLPVVPAQYLVTPQTLVQGGLRPLDSLLFVNAADGADQAQVRRDIESVVEELPTVTVKDPSGFAQEQSEQIALFLNFIYALLGLAIVIAVLGIVNTLALSVIERTREVGLLRAVGLSRRQLRRMVRLEAVVVAVLGAVLGVLLGLAFGVALQRAIADQGVDVLAVPWGQLGVFVLLAGGAGVLAAVLPARRAARLDVLRAIGTE
ncbi:MAG: FtsX-like permease family protein [Nocardioidaceae bacterium]